MVRSSFPARVLLAPALIATVAIGAASPVLAFDWGSLWPFGKKEDQVPIPDPVEYQATLEVIGGEKKLDKTLKAASTLVTRIKTPPSGIVGLLARARQDVVNLTSVLYENSRYSGQIDILIAGRPLESIDPFAGVLGRPVQVVVRVKPGPAYVLGDVEATPLPRGTSLEDLKLVPGDSAGSGKIVAAEQVLADRWRELGHPLVKLEPRDVIADHRTGRVDVRLRVVPGPRASFGRVEVKGTERVNPVLVLRRAGIEGGQYTSKVTRRAETRLRELGVFDSVRVVPGERLDPDGTIPVTIEVAERKRRVFGGGVSYSSTEGAGVEAYWVHRNLFGGAENLRLSGGVSRLLDQALTDPDFKVAARFQKPAVFDPMTDFTLRTEARRETTESYRVTAALAEVGLTRTFSDTVSGGVAFEVERSRTLEKLMTQDHLITTLTGTMVWDTRDSKLDPTKGFRIAGKIAPAYDFLQEQPFATFKVEASTYRALDRASRFVVAGRVAAGVLAVNDITKLAPDRRFYAGGGGSVRGYAYKNLGPRDGNGDLIGGRSLVEASVELRYRINDTFGFAAFVDAGNAYDTVAPKFGDLKIGAGVGLRYLTPVGPLRVDVAVPLNRGPGDPDFGLYVGLGQAF